MENVCCNTCGTGHDKCPLVMVITKNVAAWDRDKNYCDSYTEKQARLLCCPFCKSMKLSSFVDHKKDIAYIECMTCGTCGPLCRGRGAVPRSVDSWNTRLTS